MEKVKPWLGEPQNTIAVLQKYGFVFQKKYGQNFLIDPHVLDKIVAAAGIVRMLRGVCVRWKLTRI